MNAIKRIMLTAMLGLISVGAFAQKLGEVGTRCGVGFLYLISYQPNWSDSKAIVAEVMPGTPADKAGIKVGDILETVNGFKTQELSEEELTALLLNPTEGTVHLTISNFGYKDKPIEIRKNCVSVDAISEEVMARSFNLYSLEDVTERRFTMPFTYNLPAEVDFIKYTSFSMNTAKRLTAEEQSVKAALSRKGLKYMEKGGDLLVTVRSKVEENPNYRAGAESDVEVGMKNYRFNIEKHDMEVYPFLSINAPSFVGTHRLLVEVDIFDSATNTKIWSATARERLNKEYSTGRYMENFAGFMMSNFPFVRYLMNPTFVMHKNTYRSIGLYFDANDLQRILWVEKNSPAEKAGIQAGDRIITINGLPLDKSAKVMTDSYFSFVKRSMKLRDEETRYPSKDGVKNNQYWRMDKYNEVAKVMQEAKYKSAFSYLFSHRSYVHTPVIEDIVVEVKRGESTEAIRIKPELRKYDYMELM